MSSGTGGSNITAEHVDTASPSKMCNHFSGERPDCFEPVQDNIVCSYRQGTTRIFFDQLVAYAPPGGFSDLLCVDGLISSVLYFVGVVRSVGRTEAWNGVGPGGGGEWVAPPSPHIRAPMRMTMV